MVFTKDISVLLRWAWCCSSVRGSLCSLCADLEVQYEVRCLFQRTVFTKDITVLLGRLELYGERYSFNQKWYGVCSVSVLCVGGRSVLAALHSVVVITDCMLRLVRLVYSM